MDQNKFARVTSEPKKRFNGSISGKLVIRFCFIAKWVLTLLGAPNEFLRLIIIHYTFKCSFRIKTTFLESLRSQKSPLKA